MGIIKNIIKGVGLRRGRGDLAPYCMFSDVLFSNGVSYQGRRHYDLVVGDFPIDVCLWNGIVKTRFGFSKVEDVCICGGLGEGWRFCFSDVYHPHLRIEVGGDKYMGYFGRFSECNNRARSCFVVVEGGREYMFEGANVRIVLNNLMAMQVYLKFRDKFWSRLLQSRKVRDLRWRLLNMLLGVDWSWLVAVYSNECSGSGFIDELVGAYKRIIFALMDDFDCYVAGFEEESPFLPVRIEQDVVRDLVNDGVPRLIMDWLVGIVFGERLEQDRVAHLPDRWRGGVISLLEELVVNGKLRLWGADGA
jgi:hypothetical protein